ncbi:MAG: hypothetical protein JWQ11_2597 [Rhizobacter sp.]|nr:hypothetical protein [Rhizobacter sp.]
MRRCLLRICMCAAWLAATPAFAFLQAMPDAPTVPQGAVNERAALALRLEPRQNLGDLLPLATPLVDSAGHARRLGDYFDGVHPVVMVLGYYRCPNLCGTVMQGVLEALAATGLPRSDWRLVYVSVDPEETPPVAAQQKTVWDSYAHFVDANAARPMELNLLVGTASASQAIAGSAGFAVESMADEAASNTHGRAMQTTATAKNADARAPADATRRAMTPSRYAHAAEFFIATPRGRISQYFMGVRYEPRDLRLAMVSAADGDIGSLADRLVLLCSHFDPATGRYNVAVMNVLRMVGIATVLALLTYGWRHRRSRADVEADDRARAQDSDSITEPRAT